MPQRPRGTDDTERGHATLKKPTDGIDGACLVVSQASSVDARKTHKQPPCEHQRSVTSNTNWRTGRLGQLNLHPASCKPPDRQSGVQSTAPNPIGTEPVC